MFSKIIFLDLYLFFNVYVKITVRHLFTKCVVKQSYRIKKGKYKSIKYSTTLFLFCHLYCHIEFYLKYGLINVTKLLSTLSEVGCMNHPSIALL